MDIIPALKRAKADFKATDDINAFNAAVKAAAAPLAAQSDADKAKVFDALMKSAVDHMTGMEEPYEKGIIWFDSDNKNYLWEEAMEKIFGKDFFVFYNNLFEG